jgi:hypothetical protein
MKICNKFNRQKQQYCHGEDGSECMIDNIRDQ